MSLSDNQIVKRVDKLEWLYSIFNTDTSITYTLFDPELIIPEVSTRLFYRFKIFKSKLDKSEDYIKTYILMDVNPENNSLESTKKFINIAKLLKDIGLNVPIIYSFDFNNGYILVKDLGELTYYECFKRNLSNPLFNILELYKNAINSLFKFQMYTRKDILPDFNYEIQLLIMNWFIEWYLQKHCKVSHNAGEFSNKSYDNLKLSCVFQLILYNLKNQQEVFVHYDYHSRNIIYDKENNSEPGIIDFQDARLGPICYDLASLLHDSYFNLEEDFIKELLYYYWNNANIYKIKANQSFNDFCKDFEFTSLQRCIKSIGLFSRLCYYSSNDKYLQYLPNLINRCKSISLKYSELNKLYQLLSE